MPDERCEYRSKWGVHERCVRKPHSDADHWFTTPQTDTGEESNA